MKMDDISRLFNWVSVVGGLVGGCIVRLLGGYDKLLRAILWLMIFDYATGILKGIYEKKLSSQIGFRGLIKKVIVLVYICVAVIVQDLIGSGLPIREMVIMFFCCNEALSILENAAKMNVPMPKALKKVLLQLREKTQDLPELYVEENEEGGNVDDSTGI